MKVTLINTADAGGGAPAACMRLLKALEAKQVDVTLAVQEKKTAEPLVIDAVSNPVSKANFFAERLPFIFFQEKDKSVRFAFSPANSGSNISNHPAVVGADILHLHWTNSGFLSIKNLKELFALGKPIVWTLHDMWAFTGGCHYSGGCDHFLHQCGDCWMLRKPSVNDLSHKVWKRKSGFLLQTENLTVVTCSNWLGGVARTSSLLGTKPIHTIPNPIDINAFSPKDKVSMREKWNINTNARVILFGAANINDRRKGITYLVDALNQLKQNYLHTEKVEIAIFGKNKHFDVNTLPFKVYELGIINSQSDLAEIYSLADIFVSPSVEDNLPNMVMESLACGTPVTAFNTGGIPDMIDHLENGYLAEYKSAQDLAVGLHHVLFNSVMAALKENARQKVLKYFTPEIVAGQYIELYKSLLSK
ncbi:glycosyltransferase [Mucilaginibacter limnophilus]|uniref:Glycosyltransferase n=1 Tax=Mucilaginibacter limnophilus TaxID=1932778 RepID=A0A437MW31_9SPHI|nr:glycosyltransferase family 4 protein [Mucilaginibacter limnophilus]RVU01868.1 glycosyltransferase [Mucilaginibacter limnophilus]